MVALLHNQVSGNTLRTRPTSFSWEFGAGFGTMLFTGIIGAHVKLFVDVVNDRNEIYWHTLHLYTFYLYLDITVSSIITAKILILVSFVTICKMKCSSKSNLDTSQN